MIDYDIRDYEYMIISSDGLDSFYHQEIGGKIPLEVTVAQLTKFKSLKGEFLKRRTKRRIREYAKDGIFHHDDISVGILYNNGEDLEWRD